MPQGRHALVVLNGAPAGTVRRTWRHRTTCPLLRLPPYSPELNPVETVFQFLKQRNFANQVFATAEEVKDRVEEVWNDFAHTPGPDRFTRQAKLGKTGQPTGNLTRTASFAGWVIIFVFWH